MKSEISIWDNKISHGEILKKIWKHLDLGVIDRHHPFHTPVFATSCNNEANLRTVVLRRFWRKSPRGLAFHTHLGAPKVAEIQANPNVSWLFYHVEEKLQIRLKGKAEVLNEGELFEEQWNSTHPFSRRCYIGDAPTLPREKPSHGLPDHLIDRQPTMEESELGRANFAVIFSTINSIDCMELDFLGNRRSLFTWNEKSELETKWVTP